MFPVAKLKISTTGQTLAGRVYVSGGQAENQDLWPNTCRACLCARRPSSKSPLLAKHLPTVFMSPAAKLKITTAGRTLAGRVYVSGGQAENEHFWPGACRQCLCLRRTS
ncbi:hypothetical protein ISCGN_008912 [Ixodes scapularis]